MDFYGLTPLGSLITIDYQPYRLYQSDQGPYNTANFVFLDKFSTSVTNGQDLETN